MTTPCPERELLPEYLTERLEPADAARVHAHLLTCAECRRVADELEVGLTALAIARDEMAADERSDAAVARAVSGTEGRSAGSSVDVDAITDRPRPSAARRLAVLAVAASVLLVGGTVAGAALERSRATPETFAEVALTGGSLIAPASGEADLSLVDGNLHIGLDLDGLPADATFFECVWRADGESRSAGSFVAVGGAADVELLVAPFLGAESWTLDVLAYGEDAEPRVVLTASR